MVRNELSSLTQESIGSTQLRRPVRTCVGCKERVPANDLLRIVVRESVPGNSRDVVLVPDTERRLPGRGAWLHFDPECLEIAERRRAFGRALRVSGKVDLSAVELCVREFSSDDPSGRPDPADRPD